MAVHLPLSVEAQAETTVLMLSPHNIFSPANGEPIISPSQDILLGVYYTTMLRDHPDEDIATELVTRSGKLSSDKVAEMRNPAWS